MTVLTSADMARDSGNNGVASAVKDEEDRIHGVYYLDEVSRFLRVTDLSARGSELSLSSQQISSWSKRGFFDLQRARFERNKRFMQFPHLITSRMVAILRSYGVSIRRIQKAHDYLQVETGERYPFATSTVWTEDADRSSHIYTEIDKMILVTADESGQMPFEKLLKRRIVKVMNMKFDEKTRALRWEPSPGVLIDPLLHSGAPCIKGRRIATKMVYGMYMAGDPIELIEEWYELESDQIKVAIAWEERLASHEASLAD